MHADLAPRSADPRDDGLGRAVVFAIGLHALLALLLWLSTQFSWERNTSSAAGLPVIEASLDATAAEIRAAERALDHVPEPLPQPLDEVDEEETVPPPQPVPEPVPQDSPVPQQTQAQERIPVPDTQSQDAAERDAIAQEKARQEQEEKRRQEQIDLTERKRQEEAEKKQRLAKQQEEADREKKLAEIRRLRAQAAKDAQLAEQKLRQLADARARQASPSPSPAPATSGNPPAGSGGTDTDLSGKYAAAIQKAVLSQWVRPDSVPRGQRCRITIRQLPGGEVVEVEVSPSCPYDEAGRRSVESAVLRAQPLPYRGFESVFQRTLNFNFEAQDR